MVTLAHAHAHALAEARSCLAALAENAATFDALLDYEHVLLSLSTPWRVAATLGSTTRQSPNPAHLLIRAESVIEALVAHGVDALSVELLLATLADAGKLDLRVPLNQHDRAGPAEMALRAVPAGRAVVPNQDHRVARTGAVAAAAPGVSPRWW